MKKDGIVDKKVSGRRGAREVEGGELEESVREEVIEDREGRVEENRAKKGEKREKAEEEEVRGANVLGKEEGKVVEASEGGGEERTEKEKEDELEEIEGESEEEGEEVVIVEEEEEVYVPKQKPELSDEALRYLKIRMRIKSRRPKFRRQEWFRYKRLGEKWRRPKGLHSKMRKRVKYRPAVVSIGYRGPSAVRGLHPSGFREVIVHNVKDLEGVDPKTEAVRIAATVGLRKRIEIEKRAEELGIRVLNRRHE